MALLWPLFSLSLALAIFLKNNLGPLRICLYRFYFEGSNLVCFHRDRNHFIMALNSKNNKDKTPGIEGDTRKMKAQGPAQAPGQEPPSVPGIKVSNNLIEAELQELQRR